jgi:ABC-type multidrug transport system ATPase subunit
MNPAISIKNIEKKFNNVNIYDDLSFDIEEWKITAIIWPNGSGKSTLFNIISGIEKIDSGSVEKNNCEKYDFSYIFQNYRDSLLQESNSIKNEVLSKFLKVSNLI